MPRERKSQVSSRITAQKRWKTKLISEHSVEERLSYDSFEETEDSVPEETRRLIKRETVEDLSTGFTAQVTGAISPTLLSEEQNPSVRPLHLFRNSSNSSSHTQAHGLPAYEPKSPEQSSEALAESNPTTHATELPIVPEPFSPVLRTNILSALLSASNPTNHVTELPIKLEPVCPEQSEVHTEPGPTNRITEVLIKIEPVYHEDLSELDPTNHAPEPDRSDQSTESVTDPVRTNHLYVLLLGLLQDSTLGLHDWTMSKVDRGIVFFQLTSDPVNLKVKRSLFVSSNEMFDVRINNISLPQEHSVWSMHQELPALSGTTLEIWRDVIANILELLSDDICPGNFEKTYVHLWHNQQRYEKCGFIESGYDYPPLIESTFRLHDCALLTNKRPKCIKCLPFKNILKVQSHRVNARSNLPDASTSIFRPNCTMTENELKEKLISLSSQVRSLASKVKYRDAKIKRIIETEGVSLELDVANDLQNVLDASVNNLTDVQTAFWEQQKKATNSNSTKGIRWHPLLIRLALRIKVTSSSSCETVSESGCITLSSQRTLHDYTQHVMAIDDCQTAVLNKLLENIQKKEVDPSKCFFSLIFVKMNIKNNLSYNASTSELVGYLNLDDVDVDFLKVSKTLDGKEKIEPGVVRTVQVYMIRGLSCDVRDVVAVYNATVVTTLQMYDSTWKVIKRLESLGIQVLCLVSDGASENHQFFNVHTPLTPGRHTFDTVNIFSSDLRPIYFLSDPPHLLKALRDNFSDSHGHCRDRQLWNNGNVSWFFITKLFEDSRNDELRLAPKLTAHHVYLNDFSRTRLKFAAQVLSETVALALEDHFKNKPDCDVAKTVEFIRLCNHFFDCLNGGDSLEGGKYENPFLSPYTSTEDSRFAFLNDTVLTYFDDWQSAAKSRTGLFPKSDREKMTIRQNTADSVYVTVKGFTGAVKYMLDHGVGFVSARCFNQDSLEQDLLEPQCSDGASDDPNVNQLPLTGTATPEKGNTGIKKRKLALNSELPPKKKNNK